MTFRARAGSTWGLERAGGRKATTQRGRSPGQADRMPHSSPAGHGGPGEAGGGMPHYRRPPLLAARRQGARSVGQDSGGSVPGSSRSCQSPDESPFPHRVGLRPCSPSFPLGWTSGRHRTHSRGFTGSLRIRSAAWRSELSRGQACCRSQDLECGHLRRDGAPTCSGWATPHCHGHFQALSKHSLPQVSEPRCTGENTETQVTVSVRAGRGTGLGPHIHGFI